MIGGWSGCREMLKRAYEDILGSMSIPDGAREIMCLRDLRGNQYIWGPVMGKGE